jgi:hypothetical protein
VNEVIWFLTKLLDILFCIVAFKAKSQSNEFLSTWIEEFENYTEESRIFVNYLLQEARAGKRLWKQSDRWICIQNSALYKSVEVLVAKSNGLVAARAGQMKNLLELQNGLKVVY